MSPPKPKKAVPPQDDQAALAEQNATVDARLRSQKGYRATQLRGNSLIGQYLKQQTGAA